MPEMADIINRIKCQRDAVCYSGNAREWIAGLMVRMKGMAQRERVPLMIKLLMAIADTEGCRTVGDPVPVRKSDLKAESVRIYCSCNYSRRIRLDEIAAHVAMNKSAFCTFMRRHMGMSLSEYVNSIRLEKALELLTATERAVAEVAYDVGFSNIPYFNRLFRAKFGASPTQIRRGAICVKA